MLSKPTFICIPGASCTPRFYEPVVSRLSKLDYPSVLVPLPTVDAKPSKYDFSEDVIAIRDVVKKLVEDEEKEVVVVVHSYGGMPASEAIHESFGKKQRERKELKGGVIRMVFIQSFVFPEGVAPGGERGDTLQFLPIQKIDLEVGDSVRWSAMSCTFGSDQLSNSIKDLADLPFSRTVILTYPSKTRRATSLAIFPTEKLPNGPQRRSSLNQPVYSGPKQPMPLGAIFHPHTCSPQMIA